MRGLDVWAGLDAESPDRARQPRPKVLAVSYNDQCVQLELDDTPDRQTVAFDTETDVDTLLVIRSTTSTPATPPHPRTWSPSAGSRSLHQSD